MFQKLFLILLLVCSTSFSEEKNDVSKTILKPYRTFIHIQNFAIENNGDIKNPISNIKLEIRFNNKKSPVIKLPGDDEYWVIGNNQVQEINQFFEVPWEYIKNDGFKFQIQIIRKGTKFLPCNFEVTQLSLFNRQYICRLDVHWQMEQQIPEHELDKEALTIRIFTDKNSPQKDIPKDAIALR